MTNTRLIGAMGHLVNVISCNKAENHHTTLFFRCKISQAHLFFFRLLVPV